MTCAVINLWLLDLEQESNLTGTQKWSSLMYEQSLIDVSFAQCKYSSIPDFWVNFIRFSVFYIQLRSEVHIRFVNHLYCLKLTLLIAFLALCFLWIPTYVWSSDAVFQSVLQSFISLGESLAFGKLFFFPAHSEWDKLRDAFITSLDI